MTVCHIDFVLTDEICHVTTFWVGEGVDRVLWCNISGIWLAGVVLVIAGNSEYVIVIYWYG